MLPCECKFSWKPAPICALHGPQAQFITCWPPHRHGPAWIHHQKCPGGQSCPYRCPKMAHFSSQKSKKIFDAFFSEIFSANKLFLWLQKIVLDLIYQIRQEYCDLRRSVPPIFELEGGTPKMTKNHPKRPKMAFLARLMGSGNKNSCKQCWETKEIHFWPFFTVFGQFFILA